MENCKKESAHKVAKRNATKTPLKPRLRISIFQLSPGNRLLRIEQSGVASSTKVPPNLKKRESVKLKGTVKKGKQEPKNHHQSQHSPNSHALFATDSLELKLAYTAINEHTNTHKRLIFRNQDGLSSNERRTNNHTNLYSIRSGCDKNSIFQTSSIVQFIFYFWSFEISRNILRNQKASV